MTEKDILFSPITIGGFEAANRIAMAPMTRQRAYLDGTPTEQMIKYYAQRASAGIIITEGAQPSLMGQGYLFTPGIHEQDHIDGWRKVTDAVHEAGGRIVCQIMHVGRVADPMTLPGRVAPYSASDVQPTVHSRNLLKRSPRVMRPYPKPQAMTCEQIRTTVEEYRHATACAREAGFDGVQIHGSSGYLPHQFLADNTNLRTDQYGGSVENRCRFLLECIDAMLSVKGPEFLSVKISPFLTFHDVHLDDPVATYSYLAKFLSGKLAFLEVRTEEGSVESLALIRENFDGPIVATGGFTKETASHRIQDGWADMVAFGRPYIANPDLVERLRRDAPLNEGDRATTYTQGEEGYTDYPTL